jgi:hypothetical protein
MTQRDWQKDMEMCKGFLEDSGWSRRDLIAEQPQMSMYWLQEAKTLQEIASGRGREILRLRSLLGGLNDELTETEARADAAEAREQCLKEAWEQLREIVSTNATGGKGEDINDYDIMLNMMDDLLYLSSLYTDTPAPKEGE